MKQNIPRDTALLALADAASHLGVAANSLWIAGRFHQGTAQQVIRARELIAQALQELDTARRIKSP